MLVVAQEVVGAQLTLQAPECLHALLHRGVGQNQNEFLAAIARQLVLRAHRGTRHLGQVHERGVARGVAQPVVEHLEIVQIEQRHAQRRAAALAA